MVNLLQLLHRGKPARFRPDSLRRVRVDVPDEPQTTDAVFLVLRRMRGPLILFVAVFSIMSFGLSAMPGSEEHPERLGVFDSFYIVSYTGLTIGFGEVPHEFSYPQRIWVTITIYACVMTWTYAAGALIALAQERTFRQASLTEQYRALIATEGVDVSFTDDGIRAIARIAAEVNGQVENIGARRLQTVMEKLLEDVSFDAEERRGSQVVIDAAYVERQLADVARNTDLSKYVL